MTGNPIRPDRIERLRTLCLALPEAVEKETWGDPTWRVGDRIFAMQKGNTKDARPSVWMKAAEGVQGILVESDPERYFVPPYVGHQGWIGVYLDTPRLDWSAVRGLVADSHRLVAARRPARTGKARGKTARGKKVRPK